MEYITLSNGVKMPMLHFGVYQVTKEECERCVLDALKAGYRGIDTAQDYQNEAEVGAAIKASGIPREEIFLTTKIWVCNYENARQSFFDSLERLQTDYVDLLLIHQPFGNYYAAWREFEKLYDEGKIRAIGISNFYPDRMVDLTSFARVKPVVNQIELHPHYQQEKAIEWNRKYGISPEAWAPFGQGLTGLFNDPTIAKIAEAHKKTPAQVMLRWNLQRGIIVIPKSTHYERMVENIDVFDFKLTDEEMAEIATMDKGVSSRHMHMDPAVVERFVAYIKNNPR